MARTVRIYQAGPYDAGQVIELSAAASQHVHLVLRMSVGEELILFCGDNREFAARIASIEKKKVMVQLNAVSMVNRESPRQIHLGQAISKGERMEWVVQKAVELGVSSITPLLTLRSVVRLDAERLAKKVAQWQAIAIAACEQSGRNHVPMIHLPCPLSHYLEQCQAANKCLLHPYEAKSWRESVLSEGDIALLIGPEGGFSEAEVELAKQYQFQSLSLGPRILRTETATLAALSILQATRGDL